MIKRILPCFLAALLALVSCHSKDEKKLGGPLKKPAVSLAYNPVNADTEIDAYFQKLHNRRGFNGNVLVAKKGKIIYQNSFGWADYLYKDSLDINSRFQLASVSKPLTATAILMLYDNKKLKLDDDIRKYLPNFPNQGITVKMLLTHRSGLNNYQYFCDEVWDRNKPIYNDDVIKLYAQHKPAPYSKPGTTFFYCNTNYMLLASIIEKVSGKSYTSFMQDEIFRPLGMNNTIIYSKAKDKKVPTKVWGYDRVWRRSVVPNYLDGVVGDKGAYSTVRDLYVFDQALNEGLLLKKSTLALAYHAYSESKRHKHFNYGLGWRLFMGDNGNDVIYHTGWWHGFQNIFVRDVKHDITIVILSNMFNGAISQLDDLYTMVGMPVIRRGAYSD